MIVLNDDPTLLVEAAGYKLPKLEIERPLRWWHKEYENPVIFLGEGTQAMKSFSLFNEDQKIYTPHNIIGVDGAFQRKSGGWGIYFADGIFSEAKLYGPSDKVIKFKHDRIEFHKYDHVTNNRGEIIAMIVALFICKWIQTLYYKSTFEIITDSEYVLKSITIWMEKWLKNKEKKKNMDLLIPAYHIYNSIKNIKIIHVHSHIPENQIKTHPDFKDNETRWRANYFADKFAVMGIKEKYIDERFSILFKR